MVSENTINEQYSDLKAGEHCITLFGETLYDTARGYGIQIVGNMIVGKTETAKKIVEMNDRFRRATSHYTHFNYQRELLIPNLAGLEPFQIQRLLHFIKNGEKEFDVTSLGLELSLKFIERELGISPVIFERSEDDIEDTVLRLYEMLTEE